MLELGRAWLCPWMLLINLALVPAATAAERTDYQRTLEDTVLQIVVAKVGSDLQTLSIGDGEDTRVYLSISAPFVADQRFAFSVFAKGDYRVTLWGTEGQLTVSKATEIDEPAGKGLRLTYSDGTVLEVVA